MPNFTGLSKAEMQASNLGQLKKAGTDVVNGKATKHDIMAFYLDKDVDDADPVREYLGVNGQISKQTIVTQDIETNATVKSKVVVWTYYPTGEVDVIFLKDLDAAGTETQVTKIKHYLNGRKPETIP